MKKALLQSNNVNAMVSAGSKGNAINICQVSQRKANHTKYKDSIDFAV